MGHPGTDLALCVGLRRILEKTREMLLAKLRVIIGGYGDPGKKETVSFSSTRPSGSSWS